MRSGRRSTTTAPHAIFLNRPRSGSILAAKPASPRRSSSSSTQLVFTASIATTAEAPRRSDEIVGAPLSREIVLHEKGTAGVGHDGSAARRSKDNLSERDG